MRQFFVVSDIHGHCTTLKQALDAAGFDEKNESHVFVSCGDLFDRGNENRMVYDYIRSLPRKILVKGNHDERLCKILTQRRVTAADRRNGIVITLEEFCGAGCVNDNGFLWLLPDYTQVEQLCSFVAKMVDYYETAHYVFVHGWLPTEFADGRERLVAEWRNATDAQWEDARWAQWPDCYAQGLTLAHKTIVCGHRCTRYATRFDPGRAEDDDGIFRANGLIVLDAATVRSRQINVSVIRDEEISQLHNGGNENDEQ